MHSFVHVHDYMYMYNVVQVPSGTYDFLVGTPQNFILQGSLATFYNISIVHVSTW